MIKKLINIGTDDFKKMIESNWYYIDKTNFISDLLHNRGEVTLYTRPRRFGKTLNMSMLKYFFDINTDKTLFKGLNITKDKELCDMYMGKFPVVFISLKDMVGDNFEEACNTLRNIISIMLSDREYDVLEYSDKLTNSDKSKFIKLREGEYTDKATLKSSIMYLTLFLSKHYGSNVIVLIDEYDVPLAKAYEHGYYDKMVTFISSMFSMSLKTNKYLFFAVLSGCLRISKESIFTGLNNPKINTITSLNCSEYFGFTDTDVDGILSYYNLTSYKDSIKAWYDGYLFGETSIYCPWDVLNYCDELNQGKDIEPQNYWEGTSGNELIKELLSRADRNIKDDFSILLDGGSIARKIEQKMTYSDLQDIAVIGHTNPDNIWELLLATGYLTPKYWSPTNILELKIPNKEVQNLFMHLASLIIKDEVKADMSRVSNLCNAFINGDVRRIELILNSFLHESIGVHDNAIRNDLKENLYHGIVLAFLMTSELFTVRLNTSLGDGFSDISACIKKDESIGIIIEMKVANSERGLQSECETALKQIDDEGYADSLISNYMRMRRVIKYGIACYKRKCLVRKAPNDIIVSNNNMQYWDEDGKQYIGDDNKQSLYLDANENDASGDNDSRDIFSSVNAPLF